MNRSVQYIFGDGYFGGIHFYLFLNNKILNLQPIEADGYKKLLITMSAKTDSIWKHDRSKRCTYRLVWQGRLLGINQRDIGRENRSDRQ